MIPASVAPSKNDIFASFVVFIVALPLSLGIALASGSSPAAGVIASIIGGIVVGIFSGAPLVVSGPAAGLATFIFQLGTTHGFAALGLIALFAGLFQVLFGLCKVGKIFLYVPKPILEGMLAAIGVTIVLGQMHVLLGHSTVSSPLEALQKMPNSFQVAFSDVQKHPVLICSVLALAVYFFWEKFVRIKLIPAALPTVLFVTLFALNLEVPRVEVSPLFPTMEQSFHNLMQLTSHPDILTWIVAGFSLAVIASAESLLTARAIDVLAQNKNSKVGPSKLDRELMAQGFGNTASALCGGIPITGVMVRSSANVNAGATSRWSTILHGVWMGLFVITLPFALEKIPLSALAVVLVLVGLKLMNVKEFVHLWKQEKTEALLFTITMVGILATDLLSGLAIAIATHLVWRLGARYLQQPQSETNA